MEAQTPIDSSILNNKPEKLKEEKIIEKKEYALKFNNKDYKLVISRNNKFINFTISLSDDILLFNYENKFDFNNISKNLCLNPNIFKNLESVMELINDCFNKQKINLNFDRNNNMNLSIKFIQGFKEYEYMISLNKKKLSTNEIIEIILTELKTIKTDNSQINQKLKSFEKLISDLKSYFNYQMNTYLKEINLMKNKLKENNNRLNKNKEEIDRLKNEIIKINPKSKKIFAELKNERVKTNPKSKEILKNKEIYNIKKLEEHNNKDINYSINVLLVGASGAGKTCIIKSFIFPSQSTGISDNKIIKINEDLIALNIYDCTGGERFLPIAFKLCQYQDLIIFAYSIINRNSFDTIKERIKLIKEKSKKNMHFILVGCFSDLESERIISREEGKNLSLKEKFDFFIEVSAKTGDNIDNLFFEATKIIYKDKKQ